MLSWVYKELSIKCEQTMTERPFYEAEILMLVCICFPTTCSQEVYRQSLLSVSPEQECFQLQAA